MTTSEMQTMIGRKLLYTAQAIPAIVTVRDGRTVYNRAQWQVQDCKGELHWVNAASCEVVSEAGE